MEIKPIAYAKNDFKSKFGIPRQSGMSKDLVTEIIVEKDYSDSSAFRGLDGFSHIIVIWEFSENANSEWSPTVRPPRLGGNKRVGVFASRSPNRPNKLGLTCVRLEDIAFENGRTVLAVTGADFISGTPIYDIKPYLPFADCIPSATGGYASAVKDISLTVEADENVLACLSEKKRKALIEILSQDPRPHYHNDPQRIYGFDFGGYEVKFSVDQTVLKVISVEKNIS